MFFVVFKEVVKNSKIRFFKKGRNPVWTQKKPLISRKINGFF